MTNGSADGTRQRAAHRRHRDTPSHLRRNLIVVSLVLLIAAVGVVAGLQWTRPIPSSVFRPNVTTSVRLPGTSPTLPWPTTGAAALSMEGVGTFGSVGGSKSVPIASITKVMTAYLVLKDHPLAAGEAGPAIPVTASVIAAYQTGLATQQSVVNVTAGESLSEAQALEGMLIPSGNDIATMLAEWDAGTTTAFVAKMNAAAQSLGLDSTHFTDVSGLDPGSTSNTTDLIQLGEAAMALPAFAQIVAMGEVTLPVAGLIYNFDYDLGHDGIIGIKTGTDAAAGGCFLFEAQRTIDHQKVTLVGAVLGQGTSSPIDAVLHAADSLVNAAFAAITSLPVISPAHLVARITTPWNTSVAVRAPGSPRIVAWPGATVPVQLAAGTLPAVIKTGTRVGALHVDLNGKTIDVVLRAASPLGGPSPMWRLTRR